MKGAGRRRLGERRLLRFFSILTICRSTCCSNSINGCELKSVHESVGMLYGFLVIFARLPPSSLRHFHLPRAGNVPKEMTRRAKKLQMPCMMWDYLAFSHDPECKQTISLELSVSLSEGSSFSVGASSTKSNYSQSLGVHERRQRCRCSAVRWPLCLLNAKKSLG
jgi:hypothetical protein